MSFVTWLVSKTIAFLLGNAQERKADIIAAKKEAGDFNGEFFFRARNFETDYNAAVRMLRDRIDRKFPSGHYGRLRAGENSPYDHGEDRAHAVDTMSTAIAMALRDGATVKQAAEAGAASVGI
ncbi:hypothetical protein MMSR116_24940 [Methylobacterium mesophilicum SR1.6/6]|uniref:Uncharacterized protein n=1 Tax=Methylobacterium mesophilicum SR1.6/6 TaxID=908290 RepID=A0A6B9FQE2_9HYPH|nr:hypothetical protein [Methylobacterium mesophilicum]QGY04790.1 hypothetical protein MMSR116_24940 [Methylobacterium mesophilicum SR1.6/6]